MIVRYPQCFTFKVEDSLGPEYRDVSRTKILDGVYQGRTNPARLQSDGVYSVTYYNAMKEVKQAVYTGKTAILYGDRHRP